MLRCSKCLASYYCNASCQKINWPIHKPNCTDSKLAEVKKIAWRLFALECHEIRFQYSSTRTIVAGLRTPEELLELDVGCTQLLNEL